MVLQSPRPEYIGSPCSPRRQPETAELSSRHSAGPGPVLGKGAFPPRLAEPPWRPPFERQQNSVQLPLHRSNTSRKIRLFSESKGRAGWLDMLSWNNAFRTRRVPYRNAKPLFVVAEQSKRKLQR